MLEQIQLVRVTTSMKTKCVMRYGALIIGLSCCCLSLKAQVTFEFSPNDPSKLYKELFLTTVRMEVATNGNRSSGTAFMVNNTGIFTNLTNDLFLVSNRHLVEGFNTGTITFIPEVDGKPALSERLNVVVTNWNRVWFCHPSNDVDVALLSFSVLLSSQAIAIATSPAALHGRIRNAGLPISVSEAGRPQKHKGY